LNYPTGVATFDEETLAASKTGAFLSIISRECISWIRLDSAGWQMREETRGEI